MSLPSDSSGKVDGRRLRSERTRQLIIEAYMALVREFGGVPTAAQIAERAQDIDVARAERAKQRAEGRIAGSTAATDIDLERARIALMKSLIRLQVAAKVRMRS